MVALKAIRDSSKRDQINDWMQRRECAICGSPWANLTRYHDVFALNSVHRVLVTIGHPGRAGHGQGRHQSESGQDWYVAIFMRHTKPDP